MGRFEERKKTRFGAPARAGERVIPIGALPPRNHLLGDTCEHLAARAAASRAGGCLTGRSEREMTGRSEREMMGRRLPNGPE